MYRALLKKAFVEARLLLAGGVLLMFAFHWLRVWIISQLPQSQLRMMLDLMPAFVKKLSPVPIEQIATTAGRIALAYDDPLVVLIVTVWGLGRGSDAISGELGRGTLEMVLAQPVRRVGVLATQAAVTIWGAALLAVAAWLGTAAGLATITLEEAVPATRFVPAAINVFALACCLAGLTTLVSSWDRYRWRTLGTIGAVYVLAMIAKVVARAVPRYRAWEYATFLTAFEPQALVADPARSWAWAVAVPDGGWQLGALGYDAILLGLGAAGYLGAALIFSRRDLPPPL